MTTTQASEQLYAIQSRIQAAMKEGQLGKMCDHLEAKISGFRRQYLVYMIVVTVLILLLVPLTAHSVSLLLTVIYPAASTLSGLLTNGIRHPQWVRQWLAYWVVFSLLSITDCIFGSMVYWPLKTISLLWAQLPDTLGATIILEASAPYLQQLHARMAGSHAAQSVESEIKEE